MRYLSVCSGIEAASVAWTPLGFDPVAFSEVEPYPCAVLAHHYPDVPNLGDMNGFEQWPDDLAPDILVGGTPCQSFSVAGLRGGLADERGNLALVYMLLARRYRPRWVAWENVPGVLSSDGGRAFGAILGALAELGYGFAWRVLDAQYYGVPQRRRRVFLIGHTSGDAGRAAQVLFEPKSLRGDTPPSRPSREETAAALAASTGHHGYSSPRGDGSDNLIVADVAPTLPARTRGGGGLGSDFDHDGGLIVSHDPACSLNARDYKGPLPEADLSTGVAYAIQERAMATNPASGPDGAGVRSDDMAYTLEARTTPQAVAFDMRGGEGGAQMEGPHETANLRAAGGGSSRSYIAESIVRRLTPVECERLQGFPDGYTDIPWPRLNDGHRYKALGNSMAVPVVRWIGERIQRVDRGEDLWT